jgi:hypothetical protein
MKTSALSPVFAASVCLGSLTGCSEPKESYPEVQPEPAAGCESHRFEPCNIYSRQCQRDTFASVACLWGAPDAPLPTVRFLTAEEFRDGVRASYAAAEIDLDFSHVWGTALSLLELGNPDDYMPAAMADLIINTVPAFYSAGMVTFIEPEEPTPERDFGRLTVLLAHEFTHSLQEATVDWAAIGPAVTSYDAQLGNLAISEGSAELVAGLFSAAMWGLDAGEVDFVNHVLAWVPAIEADLSDESVLLGSQRYFPYSYGAEYVYGVYQARGMRGVRGLYEPLPWSTLPIVTGPDADVPARALPFEPEAPTAPEGVSVRWSDTLGAWVLRKFLERTIGVGDWDELVAAWRGDRIFAFDRDAEEVTSVWRLNFDSATAAQELLERLQDSDWAAQSLWLERDGSELTLVATDTNSQSAREAWLEILTQGAPIAGDAGAVGSDAGSGDAGDSDVGRLDGGAPARPDAAISDGGR